MQVIRAKHSIHGRSLNQLSGGLEAMKQHPHSGTLQSMKLATCFCPDVSIQHFFAIVTQPRKAPEPNA